MTQADIDALMRRLERERFDIAAVGRALLSDPAWARKLHDGREAEIVAFESKRLSIVE